LVFATYLNGYHIPPGSPPLTHIFTAPLDAAGYFFALLGAPFSYTADAATAVGFIMVLIACIVLKYANRAGILRSHAVLLSLIIFAALASAVVVLGRSGFGLQYALSSRYTSMTSIGIIGLYLLTLSTVGKLPVRAVTFAFHGLLILVLMSALVSYSEGWQVAHADKASKELEAYVLLTNKFQADENLTVLYPAPAAVRARAGFLEQKQLNVFSVPPMDLSTLALIPEDALYALDSVNGKPVGPQQSYIAIDAAQQRTILVIGWAADKQRNDAASAVYINVDGNTDIPSLYGQDRADVAKVFNSTNLRYSGYMATFATSLLATGEHYLSLKIVAKDRSKYYFAKNLVRLAVK
jgi:hypothetical protein